MQVESTGGFSRHAYSSYAQQFSMAGKTLELLRKEEIAMTRDTVRSFKLCTRRHGVCERRCLDWRHCQAGVLRHRFLIREKLPGMNKGGFLEELMCAYDAGLECTSPEAECKNCSLYHMAWGN